MTDLQNSSELGQSSSSSKSRYRVSVVIPTYNRSALISEALKSLQHQTNQGFEIIVVDDCSTDDTENAVKKFADPRLVYIRHDQNCGGASARNTGIRAASGDFVAFLDSDDQWMPEKLEKQLELFERDSRTGAVYTGVNAVDGERLLWRIVPLYRGDLTDRLFEYNYIDTTSSVMVKKELLLDVNGFDEKLPSCQDWDLYIRIAPRTKMDFVKEPLVSFQQHSGDRITTNSPAVVNGHVLIYEKHKKLALERGAKVFGKFNLTIGKILLKNGVFSRNKRTVKLSRDVLKEALTAGIRTPQHILLYCSTFIHLALLNAVYLFSKKRASKVIRFFGSAYSTTNEKTSV